MYHCCLSGVPESFLINANGEIVHTWKGPFDAISQDTQARILNVVSSSEDGNSISNRINGNPNLDSNTNSTSAVLGQAPQKLQSSQESTIKEVSQLLLRLLILAPQPIIKL